MRFSFLLSLVLLIPIFMPAQQADKSVRIAIIGLTHDHIGFMGNPSFLERVEVVGVAESNDTLRAKYAKQFGWSEDILYDDWSKMVKATKPEGVMVFTSPYEHLEAVKVCAPLGVHVMVEKPFSVSMAHANEMAKLAKEHEIMLLTNYETTWYASNHAAYRALHEEQKLGELRKVVVHDGHYGPKELGCTPEFLEWLFDAKLNGGGALTDFGCYGANLITWLMQDEKPISVMAITQQIKTDPAYAEVDDEATIILTYPKMQGVIQASWNWPYNRKDMEVYGTEGFFHPQNGSEALYRADKDSPTETLELEAREAPYNNPVTYFAACIREEISPEGSLNSLENNLIVTEILDAARESARTGEVVELR
ncbi:MAG: Gfo/Idh/MocA family oxidoreductase [Bacteroidota bacterium]